MELFSPRVQFRPSEHSSSAQAANSCSGVMDQHDTDLLFLHAPPPVRIHLCLHCRDQPSLKLVVAMVAAYSSYPPLWPFLLVYMIWIHIDSAPEHGGRLSPWFRSIRFWKFFAEYYPASYVYFTLTLAHCVDPPHPHQGIRRQAWHLSPLVCSFKRFFRSAISRQIGRICLVITLMVCLHIYDARISSLKTSLLLGIISM